MKKKYKLMLTGAILALILGISVIHLTDKLTVNTEQVEKTDFQDTIEENGSVVSADKVTLSAELNGVVLTAVKENTPVVQGQEVLTIDSSQIEHQIAQLRGNLQSIQGQKEMSMPPVYQSQIDAQKLEIESTKVAMQDLEKNIQDAKLLYEAGSISKSELDNLELSYEQLQIKKNAQEKQLNLIYEQGKPKAGTDKMYDGQQKSVLENMKLLENQKQKAVLRSPINGVVSEILVKPGELAQLQSPVVTIINKDRLQIESYVLTDDVIYLHVGDKVNIRQETNSEDLSGTGVISEISAYATEQRSGLGLDEKKVKVIVSIQDKGTLNISANYDVLLDFVLKEMKDVITIPKSAMFHSKDGKDAVFVVKNGKAVIQEVTVAYESNSKYVIEEGLEEGDEVIKDPNIEGLKENVAVKSEQKAK